MEAFTITVNGYILTVNIMGWMEAYTITVYTKMISLSTDKKPPKPKETVINIIEVVNCQIY